jgi:hypothetical protein
MFAFHFLEQASNQYYNLNRAELEAALENAVMCLFVSATKTNKI